MTGFNLPIGKRGKGISGLYFVVVDLTAPNGHLVQKQVTQIVIER